MTNQDRIKKAAQDAADEAMLKPWATPEIITMAAQEAAAREHAAIEAEEKRGRG